MQNTWVSLSEWPALGTTHTGNQPACIERTFLLAVQLAVFSQKAEETVYIMLIHSVLEYAAIMWDPYLKKDINHLVPIQNRSARSAWFVCNNYSWESSMYAMKNDLGWLNLADRRSEIHLMMLFKIVHGLVEMEVDDYLTKADSRMRSNHNLKYEHIPHSNQHTIQELISSTNCT